MLDIACLAQRRQVNLTLSDSIAVFSNARRSSNSQSKNHGFSGKALKTLGIS